MEITLKKENKCFIRSLSKEEQVSLKSVDLSYEELKDNHIMAMIFGHGVDILNIEICETDCIDSIIALMLSASQCNILSIETCNSSFEILSVLYPEKKALLRRAKMLGRNMLEVIKDE